MVKKLSPAAAAKCAGVRALAVVGMLVIASAIAASTASAAKPQGGEWTVRPGKSLQLTNMTINGCDTDTGYIFVDGLQYDTLGSNSGNECNTAFPGDYTYMPTDGLVHTVTLEVYDSSVSCGYFSDGDNGAATRTEFAINDGGGSCSILPVTPSGGNFHGNVSVFHTPR